MTQLLQSFKPYFSSKILAVGFLSFASGLPILMTLSTLIYWFSKYGIEKQNIGFVSLAGLPYVLKILWAPLLDNNKFNIFKKLGKRKGWIVFFQLCLCLIFFLLSYLNPKDNITMIAMLIFFLSFSSASQDIVIDAYRIDLLSNEEQPFGASISQLTYRIALLVMGAGVLTLSDHISWASIFKIISILFFIIMCCTLVFIKDKPINSHNLSDTQNFKIFFKDFIISPLENFLTRDKAVFIIIFLILFKLPDAVANLWVPAFYNEMGYTGTQIGIITKIYGLIATLTGIFFSAKIIQRINLFDALSASLVLMGLTNLSYLLIILSPTPLMLGLAITVENFINGFASATIITLMSLLCNKQYSAMQYALLSSLAAINLRFLGSATGYIVDYLGWQNFFIFTAFLFVPALLVLMYIKNSIFELQHTTREFKK